MSTSGERYTRLLAAKGMAKAERKGNEILVELHTNPVMCKITYGMIKSQSENDESFGRSCDSCGMDMVIDEFMFGEYRYHILYLVFRDEEAKFAFTLAHDIDDFLGNINWKDAFGG